MDVFVGVVMVLVGLGLLVGAAAVGDATHRSNVAFTKGRAFTGPG